MKFAVIMLNQNLSGNIETLELLLPAIRQKMLENTKFVAFPVICLTFDVRVNLRG